MKKIGRRNKRSEKKSQTRAEGCKTQNERPKEEEDTKTQKAAMKSNFVRDSIVWREKFDERQRQILEFTSKLQLVV